MNQKQSEIPTRGRFKNVVNVDAVPKEGWGDDTGKFGSQAKEIAVALGAQALGFCVATIEPGKRSCPFHFHHLEEELFFVLEGKAILRQGDREGEEEIVLEPGDFASFPAGTGIAHQFINNGDVPFVFLAMSNRIEGDVAEYPDSNKVLLRRTRMMLKRSPTFQYFDGEV